MDCNLATLPFTIFFLTLVHITAILVWIGAHFFELSILHVSLSKVDKETRYRVYSNLLPRFNRVTGLGAVATVYSGSALAIIYATGSLMPLISTPWGVLITLFAILMFLGLVLPLKPQMIGRLLSSSLYIALLAAIVFIVMMLTGDSSLKFFLVGTQGPVILASALIALAVLFMGATMGITRVKIGALSSQVEQNPQVSPELEKLEHHMKRMTIPENIVTAILIILMVLSARPF